MLWLGFAALAIALVVAAHLARTTLVRRLHGSRIEAEVRRLFGPAAQVGRIEIDAKWRLVLSARELAIPGGLTLDVREARIRGVARPESAVVELIDGTLRWRGLVAPVSYRASAAPTAPLDGALTARGATWRAGAPAFDFDGTLRVAKGSYSLIGTRISSDGATATGKLEGTDGPPRTTLHFANVGASLLAPLVALMGEHPLAIPATSKTSGDLTIEPDFARRLDAVLETPSSRLTAAFRAGPAGALDGSTIAGRLSFADALAARIFPTRIRPRPVGDATLELALRGPLDAWILSGPVRAARIEVEAHTRANVVLAATEVVCAIEVDARGVRWSGLEASFLGGRVAGSGILDAEGHATDLRIEGVRVHELPTGMKDPLLAGAARGTVSVRGRGDDTTRLEGGADLELHEPEYPFLREASQPLRAFGLPPLAVRGTTPLEVRIEARGGRVLFRRLSGRVEGLRFEGDIELSWSGSLAGRIEAHLDERYLRQSLLLAVPALLAGQVSVPLEISGRVGAPRYSADLVGTIGKLVTGNSVTGAIGGLVDGLLGNIFGGERRDDDPERRRRR